MLAVAGAESWPSTSESSRLVATVLGVSMPSIGLEEERAVGVGSSPFFFFSVSLSLPALGVTVVVGGGTAAKTGGVAA